MLLELANMAEDVEDSKKANALPTNKNNREENKNIQKIKLSKEENNRRRRDIETTSTSIMAQQSTNTKKIQNTY
jgi:hypothetical protein